MSKRRTETSSRRRFLKGAALSAGAALGALAAPRVSRAETQVLRMQSCWPAGQIFHEMAEEYVELVQRMAGRRLRIDLRPAGAIVNAPQVYDACSDGRLDVGHGTISWIGARHSAVSLFCVGPAFGVDAQLMLGWMHRGGGQELYDELLQRVIGLNVVVFFTLPMPNQPFGWFRQPVKTTGDLVGMRYRTVFAAAGLVRRIGMILGGMPPAEAKQAMERGMLDGLELNNPTFDRRFGAQDVADHYIMASFHQGLEFLEVIFNRDRFAALPHEFQAILRHGAQAASTANYATALDQYSHDLRTLIEEDGVNISRTSDAILDGQLKAWEAVLEEEAADPFFAKVVASQREWCERVGFYHHMNTPDYARAYRHFFPDRLTG